MELYCRELGQGETTIVIVHGLYGASDNWLSIASKLEDKYRIILPDQRNHGQSDHSATHTYEAMSDDLYETLRKKVKEEKVILLGHSMGGKTAMRMTMKHPEMVRQLVIADIAPKDYGRFANYAETTANHENILKALQSLHPETMESRSEMDAALKKQFPVKTLRQFLLKNVKRQKNGRYHWQLNLEALLNNLPELMDGFSHLEDHPSVTGIPTVFIRGEKSPYIKDEDVLVINKFFPGSQLVTIPDAGHWLHAEQPELFLKTLLYYIE